MCMNTLTAWDGAQQVEMLAWVVMVNALTMARHRAAEGLKAVA
jgi:hypothetical protein